MNTFVLMIYDKLPRTCKSRDKDWMISRMNTLGKEGRAFFFMVDFSLQHFFILPDGRNSADGLLFSINGVSNHPDIKPSDTGPIHLRKKPISFLEYERRFMRVRDEIKAGNTFLLNLTAPTKIELSHSLRDIYLRSQARYKVLVGDDMLVFSPETFIRIENSSIETHPMKGTIDADLPNARERLLNDPKEKAEHYTIVDLLRNDLSMVAHNIHVEKFRYLQKINSSGKALLQVSSKITGKLATDYARKLGDILMAMLPAGSVSGAPKQKTIEIIRETEGYERGFYTGIMGYWDGKVLDTGVMIRFIERANEGLVFKSGGGITWDSKAEDEYQELIDKVYVPVI